jgi:hypothetical protein
VIEIIGKEIAAAFSKAIIQVAARVVPLFQEKTKLRRERLADEIVSLQAQLFGMHSDKPLVVLDGFNRGWRLVGGNDDFRGGRPPYNYSGIYQMVSNCASLAEILTLDEIDSMPADRNLLVMGGVGINDEFVRWRKRFESELAYDFVPRDWLAVDKRGPAPPDRITRVFTEGRGTRYAKRYEKISKTGRYLVNMKKGEKQDPLGPFVDDQGHITGDVLTLSVHQHPKSNSRHAILARAGYGASCLLGDVLFNIDVLREIAQYVQGEQYFEVVFTTKVKHRKDREDYSLRRIEDIRVLA